MFMTRRFKFFRVGPIQIYIDYLWFIAFFLFSYVISRFYALQIQSGPTYLPFVLSGITVIALYTCILIHELAHSFVSIKSGIPVKQITLMLFGAAAHIEGQIERPVQEFQIAIVGPMTNFAIADFLLKLLLILYLWKGLTIQPVLLLIACITIMNLGMGIFNLFPIFPMDGGRILRSIIWFFNKNQIKATQIAISMGWCLLVSLVFIGFMFRMFWLLWPAFIIFWVMRSGSSELKGLIIRKILNEKKAVEIWTKAYHIPEEKRIYCQTTTNVWEVVELMKKHQTKRIFIKSGDKVIGSISINDINDFLQMK